MPRIRKLHFRIAHSESAQNVLEYSILLTLVMVGIIIMGPYVIRSWNANVKGWEDSVIDSMTDNLIEAPSATGLPPCNCSYAPPPVPNACGHGTCQPFELAEVWQCLPIDCDPNPPVTLCTFDPSCCLPSAPANPFKCGLGAAAEIPLGHPENTRPDGLAGCPDGEGLYFIDCGDPAFDQYTCEVDPLCTFTCQGILDANATWCPGYNVGLTIDTPITYRSPKIGSVNDPSYGCQGNVKCEAVCNGGPALYDMERAYTTGPGNINCVLRYQFLPIGALAGPANWGGQAAATSPLRFAAWRPVQFAFWSSRAYSWHVGYGYSRSTNVTWVPLGDFSGLMELYFVEAGSWGHAIEGMAWWIQE